MTAAGFSEFASRGVLGTFNLAGPPRFNSPLPAIPALLSDTKVRVAHFGYPSGFSSSTGSHLCAFCYSLSPVQGGRQDVLAIPADYPHSGVS